MYFYHVKKDVCDMCCVPVCLNHFPFNISCDSIYCLIVSLNYVMLLCGTVRVTFTTGERIARSLRLRPKLTSGLGYTEVGHSFHACALYCLSVENV